MTSTLPPSASPVDSALSGIVRPSAGVQPRPSDDGALPPSAAKAIDPAVVNHVRASHSSATEAAGADPVADPGAASRSSAERDDEAKAEVVRELKKRDAEVRAHEQAHAAVGGAFAGAPSYEMRRGPDGRSYAVGGEVPIDVSAVAGNPEATIIKMQQVKRAALAPREPSDADRAIAASADAMILAARRELSTEAAQKSRGTESTRDAESFALLADAPSAGLAAREAFSQLERRNAGAAAYAPPRVAGALDLVS